MRADIAEPIEVAPFDDAPAQFLLRGRLHVVRAVLASWREPGGWRWSGPGEVVAVPVGAGVGAGERAAAAPVAASAPVDPADRDGAAALPFIPAVPIDLGDRQGAAPLLPSIPAVPIDLGDRDVWRVEAAAGMSDRPRVFDMCRDPERARWTATLVEE